MNHINNISGDQFGADAARAFFDVIEERVFRGNVSRDLFDLGPLFLKAADQFNHAVRAAIKHADVGGHIKFFGKDIGDALAEVISYFFKNVAFKATPWIVLSGAAIVGTPFFVSYVYYRVKHNIGRPELATEIKYVDFYYRMKDRAVRVAGTLWNAAQNGIRWGAIGCSTGYVAVFSFVVAKEYFKIRSLIYPVWAMDNIPIIIGSIAATGALSSIRKEAFDYLRG